jgi:hypothetical protein
MDSFTERFKNTAFLRAFTFWNIPLIWWIRPTVLEMGRNRTVIEIKLRRRTRSNLRSMYFGAIAIGSELVVAAKTVQAIAASKQKVDFVFTEFSLQFLKRAEGDVHFICEQGAEVEALISKCLASGVRETQTYEGYAIVPAKSPSEKVATFTVTLSARLKRKK